MRRSRGIFAIAILCMLGMTAAACSGTRTSESTGEYVDDTAISTKVRAKIVSDEQLSIFDIDVETFKGVVQLSGFVDSPAAKAHATQVASDVNGVKSVKNDLVVK